MKAVYAWNVWDHLKDGEVVYAVETDGTAPNTINLSACTVYRVAQVMKRHEEDNQCYYFVSESEETEDE